MKGRKPLPANVKRLRGTDQPCRMNKLEPNPGTDCIVPPVRLSEKAMEHWDKTVETLTAANMITNVDAQALAAYCVNFTTWHDAIVEVDKEGAVITGASGIPQRSPHLIVAEKALVSMMKFLTEFGMTPSSRTRVNVVKEKEDKNPFSKFKAG